MEPLRSKDKRAGIRIPLLSERATYHLNGQDIDTDIGDITNEGLFLKTETLLAPQTKIQLRLTLPGDLGSLQVSGTVVRVNWAATRKKGKDHLGMGIRFDDVSPNIKKILDAFVVYLRSFKTYHRRILW